MSRGGAPGYCKCGQEPVPQPHPVPRKIVRTKGSAPWVNTQGGKIDVNLEA